MRPRQIIETLRDLFYPPHCAGCGTALDGGWLCQDCQDGLHPVHAPFCDVCSQPFTGSMEHLVCANCRGREFFFDHAVAVMQSHGLMRDLIHRLKYGGETWMVEMLVDFLERGLHDRRLVEPRVDGLVPVPLHPLRRREREFNQAELLARTLARRCDLPVVDGLRRVRFTVTQTHFDRRRRMQNLRDAFEIRQNTGVQGKHLLLVDDVLTTGSTLNECARVLLDAGALSVRGLTVARG